MASAEAAKAQAQVQAGNTSDVKATPVAVIATATTSVTATTTSATTTSATTTTATSTEPVVPDIAKCMCLGVELNVVPVQDMPMLILLWPFPTHDIVHYKSRPLGQIASILGFEGSGSILEHLKSRGFAVGLSAGVTRATSTCTFFALHISLTEEGLARRQKVVQFVYDYIHMLGGVEEKEWRRHFEEIRSLANTAFRFREVEEVTEEVTWLAKQLHYFPTPELLTARTLYEVFDMKLIHSFLSRLTVANSQQYVESKTFEGKTTKEEPIYNVQYNLLPHPPVATYEYDAKTSPFSFPAPNPFIATDFTLKSTTAVAPADRNAQIRAAPVLVPLKRKTLVSDKNVPMPTPSDTKIDVKTGNVTDPVLRASGKSASVATAPDTKMDVKPENVTDPVVRLYHKLDHVFRQPVASVLVHIVTPVAYASPKTNTLVWLYMDLLNDALCHISYPAGLASMQYKLELHGNGIACRFSGYNHKLSVFVEKVMRFLRHMTVDPARFQMYKRQHIRALEQAEFVPPHATSDAERDLFTRSRHCSREEQLYALRHEITDEQVFKSFIPALFERAHVNVFVHGNATCDEAIEWARSIVEILDCQRLPTCDEPDNRLVRLEDQTRYVRVMDAAIPGEENSCSRLAMQVGEATPTTAATFLVLQQLLSVPFFEQLRTKETLGYAVELGAVQVGGVTWLRCILLSGEYPAHHLERRAEACLEFLRLTVLQNMTTDAFVTAKESALARLLEIPRALAEETETHWSEIARRRYAFDRLSHEEAAIRALTKKELLDAFDRYIRINAPQRRVIVVNVEAKRKNLSSVAITDSKSDSKAVLPSVLTTTTTTTTGALAPTTTVKTTSVEGTTLPPVPVDRATVVPLTCSHTFKRSMCLLPVIL